MKKVLKKVISVTLTLALAVSGIVYTNDVKAAADAENWEANAIKVPAEGALIGAGYIDVEFDNSLEGYTYTVELDGQQVYWNGDDIVKTDIGEEKTEESVTKTFTSEDEGKTEVYTTTVSKHEITVKASNGKEEKTAKRTFYVSKKGLALGGDMSDKVSLKKLNCSWYYNWATEAFNNSVDEDVAHIPMMWGGGDDNKESMENFSSDSNYILGFNEPDIGSQANMNSAKGIRVWNEYILPLKQRKVSPAPANPNGASEWITDFLNGLTVFKTEDGEEMKYLPGDPGEPYFLEGTDCDAIALHYYRGTTDVEDLLASVESVWNAYHKPIWVTEVSVMGRKGTDYDYSYDAPGAKEKVMDFVEGVVRELDARPYVERYAWFPYDVESANKIDGINGSGATAMFEFASGLYTDLGIRYSQVGNPEGYGSYKISNDEVFVWENRIPIETEETTIPEVTTKGDNKTETTSSVKEDNKVETTTPQPMTDKVTLSKTKIKKIKNIKKKSVSLTWKKVAKAKQYKVQYTTNKKFKKGVKTKKVKILSTKIKGLKKKKTYYFRVCAVNGKIQGKWSAVKKVKIKK